MNKIKFIVLMVLMCFSLTGCDEDLSAKTLARWNCKMTGEKFKTVESVCVGEGRSRCDKMVDQEVELFVYDCPTKGRVLSKSELIYN